MIRSWKHKGLRRFFQRGISFGIQTMHQTKLKIILQYDIWNVVHQPISGIDGIVSLKRLLNHQLMPQL